MSLGYSKKQAKAALRKNNGDVDAAAAHLVLNDPEGDN